LVLLVPQDLRDHLVLLVHKGQLVRLVCLVCQVLQELLVRREQPVAQARQVFKARPERSVSLVLLARPVQQGRQVL